MALVFHNSPNVFSQITAFLSHKCKVMRNIIYGVMQNVPKCVRRQAWRIGERIARKAIYLWYQKHKRAGGGIECATAYPKTKYGQFKSQLFVKQTIMVFSTFSSVPPSTSPFTTHYTELLSNP